MKADAEARLRRNVLAALKVRGIDQVQLAYLMGLSQPTISKLLSGKQKFRVEHLDDLAAVFGVTVAQLVADYGSGTVFERRTGRERRSGQERRQHPAMRIAIEDGGFVATKMMA